MHNQILRIKIISVRKIISGLTQCQDITQFTHTQAELHRHCAEILYSTSRE